VWRGWRWVFDCLGLRLRFEFEFGCDLELYEPGYEFGLEFYMMLGLSSDLLC
jgi:hypothetical protein